MDVQAQPFAPPTIIDRPFAPPIETVLDLPPPISVNRARRVDFAARSAVRAWIEQCDRNIMAAGGMRKFAKMPGAFEAVLIVDETANGLDLDNAVKGVIDYARRVGLIIDDSKKYMRRVTIEWGAAPLGCRLILRSVLP